MRWILRNNEAITDALFTGNFYASQGPEIYDLYLEDGKIHVTCSDADMILLNTAWRTAKSAFAKPGEALKEAVFDYNEEDVYLKITVRDKNGKYADTNQCHLVKSFS